MQPGDIPYNIIFLTYFMIKNPRLKCCYNPVKLLSRKLLYPGKSQRIYIMEKRISKQIREDIKKTYIQQTKATQPTLVYTVYPFWDTRHIVHIIYKAL